MQRTAALFIALGILVGCANPGIVKISPDTYLLAREAHGGVFASAAKLKAGVIRDANAFAARQGKVAVPISAKEKPMGNGPAQWASFEYQFRVVDKNDPAVRRTQLVHNPDVVILRTDPARVGRKERSELRRMCLMVDQWATPAVLARPCTSRHLGFLPVIVQLTTLPG